MASNIMFSHMCKCMLSGKDVPWTAQPQLPGSLQASGQTWKPSHHLQDAWLQELDFILCRSQLDLICSRGLNRAILPVRASFLSFEQVSHLGVCQ